MIFQRRSLFESLLAFFTPALPAQTATDRRPGPLGGYILANRELNESRAFDIVVAGGGIAGTCAAIAAARHGAKVALVHERSMLGGNASSEVKMHIVGADMSGGRPGWREGGLIEEFRLDEAVANPQRSREMWDLLLYDKVKSEPNITPPT